MGKIENLLPTRKESEIILQNCIIKSRSQSVILNKEVFINLNGERIDLTKWCKPSNEKFEINDHDGQSYEVKLTEDYKDFLTRNTLKNVIPVQKGKTGRNPRIVVKNGKVNPPRKRKMKIYTTNAESRNPRIVVVNGEVNPSKKRKLSDVNLPVANAARVPGDDYQGIVLDPNDFVDEGSNSDNNGGADQNNERVGGDPDPDDSDSDDSDDSDDFDDSDDSDDSNDSDDDSDEKRGVERGQGGR